MRVRLPRDRQFCRLSETRGFSPCSIHAIFTAGSCPSGFSGPQCAVCQTAAACATATSNAAATCNTGFQFTNSSTVKSYSCDPTSPSLVTGLLVPGSMLIQCHTGLSVDAPTAAPAPAPEASPPDGELPTPLLPIAAVPSPLGELVVPPVTPAPAPDALNNANINQAIADFFKNATSAPGNLFNGRRLMQDGGLGTAQSGGAYCGISFMVKSPNVQVACTASSCSVQPGSSSISCQESTCACPGDSTCGGSGKITRHTLFPYLQTLHRRATVIRDRKCDALAP